MKPGNEGPDIDSVISDTAIMKSDMAAVKTDIASLGTRIDGVNQRLDRLFLTLVAGLMAMFATVLAQLVL